MFRFAGSCRWAFRDTAIHAAHDVFLLVEEWRLNDLALLNTAIWQAHGKGPANPDTGGFEMPVTHAKAKRR